MQWGDDLGERMSRAFAEILPHHEKAVLIGSDISGLTPEILSSAFDGLSSHDAVVGPVVDGGYYLIGMKKFQPEIFENIEWSTPVVFYQTLEHFKRLGISHFRTPILADIDYADDWNRHGWEL
jgi:hypothetical protein